MMKIVINKKAGGFGISGEAVLYLLQKGSDLVSSFSFEEARFNPEEEDLSQMVPASIDGFYIDWAGSLYEPANERIYHCRYMDNAGNIVVDTVSFRMHPDLIEVVEKLGEDADGPFSCLKIVSIVDPNLTPDNLVILENGGIESIHEVHRIWE